MEVVYTPNSRAVHKAMITPAISPHIQRFQSHKRRPLKLTNGKKGTRISAIEKTKAALNPVERKLSKVLDNGKNTLDKKSTTATMRTGRLLTRAILPIWDLIRL